MIRSMVTLILTSTRNSGIRTPLSDIRNAIRSIHRGETK
jgi:hypothetical protein